MRFSAADVAAFDRVAKRAIPTDDWRHARRFWDYLSGNCFQQGQTVAQPGSLESEAGIFAMGFDHSGTRLVTCEADKSIKMWKEDANATPETHPVQFRPPKDIVRRYG